MQSAASSAGYSTGGTLTAAVAALLLLTGQHMPLGTTFAWIFFIAVLGVTMAMPMKRQMINIEQIRFPDSIATAETLKVLYSEDVYKRQGQHWPYPREYSKYMFPSSGPSQ